MTTKKKTPSPEESPKKRGPAARPELPKTNQKSPPPKSSPKGGKTTKKENLWKSEKIVKKVHRVTKKETEEQRAQREKEWEERRQREEKKRKADIFQLVDHYAAFLVKKQGFLKMKFHHAQFSAFISLPECLTLTQNDFVQHSGCSVNSPANWKARNDVMKGREVILYRHIQTYTPAVLKNLAESAQQKNPWTWLADGWLVKLFLQVAEKWSEKTQVEHSGYLEMDIFTMDLPPSQFVKKDKLPRKPWEDDPEEEDDSPPDRSGNVDEDSPEELDEVESL